MAKDAGWKPSGRGAMSDEHLDHLGRLECCVSLDGSVADARGWQREPASLLHVGVRLLQNAACIGGLKATEAGGARNGPL